MTSDILKKSHLSITAGRKELLRVLSLSEIPLSEKEIEALMKTECNRTTIYRNLNRLFEKGLVYRIVADGIIKYKYSRSGNNQGDNSEHVHFKCDNCNKVICLHEFPVQLYSLPQGFTRKENQFLIVGVCKECNSRNGKKI